MGYAGALIPLLSFLGLTLLLHLHAQKWSSGVTLRDALLTAAVLCGAWLTLTTELFSLFHAITFPTILLAWLLPIPPLAYALYRSRTRFHDHPLRLPSLSLGYILLPLILFILTWSF